MNAADLIAACLAFEEERGVNELLILLNDTLLARAQAAGMSIEFLDGEDEELVFHTVQ
ncbi:hypothetical protein [Sinorhizobium meliloti]|jgi:hypothetical protein|uniref:hypothetical protein n=1 Tax=Rhizobium meliloti TaxID=382 RepID=UPI00129609B6|nr:hypothetical protein [Sinorhizobium meliloti]MQU83617.1 hypothetical protein [Sinorhizobium meliloti]